MTDLKPTNGTWQLISRIAGLTLIATVVFLRSIGRLEWQDAQLLLFIAAALLGIIGLLRGQGK